MHSGTTGGEGELSEVEFAVLHAPDESIPFSLAELQGWARSVLAVPDIDRVADAHGDASLDWQKPGNRGSYEPVLLMRVPFSVVGSHDVLLSKNINAVETFSARNVDAGCSIADYVNKSSAAGLGLEPR